MKQFLSWLATVIVGLSFLIPYMLHPGIDTLLTMLLGLIGLVMGVIVATVERRQLERQIKSKSPSDGNTNERADRQKKWMAGI